MSGASAPSSTGRATPTARGPISTCIVEWAAGAGTALDVATGGGHVARRLREAGHPGRQQRPRARDAARRRLRAPRTCRSPTAASTSSSRASPRTTSTTSAQAVAEMARVAADAVLIVDNSFMGEEVEEAEKLRDPSHVRNYGEAEWRSFARGGGPRRRGRAASSRSRSSCSRGSTAAAARARRPSACVELLGDRVQRRPRRARPHRAEGRCLPDGDHRRQRHAARRPGPDGLRGPLPRPAQPRLRHEPRRRRDARQGRPGRRGRAGLRHGRRGGLRAGREHGDDLRPGAVRRRRRSTRRSTPGSRP